MNEVMENQSDAHPTQINRVATRSNSKMSFIFRSSWLGYCCEVVSKDSVLSNFIEVFLSFLVGVDEGYFENLNSMVCFLLSSVAK